MTTERHWYFTHIAVANVDIFAPCVDADERAKTVRDIDNEYKAHIGGDGYIIIRSTLKAHEVTPLLLETLKNAAVDYIEGRKGDPRKGVYWEDIMIK